MPNSRRSLFLSLALLALPACRGDSQQGSSAKAPGLVHSADEVQLSEKDVELAAPPRFLDGLDDPSRAAKLEQLKQGLVRAETLSKEAVRRGLDRSPRVRRALRNALVEELRAEEVASNPPVLSEQDLRAHYERHREEFLRPELRRVSHVFVASSTDKAKGQRARRDLESARLQLREGKSHFEEIVVQQSQDETSKSTGGDLGPKTQLELANLWGEPFAQSVFALTDRTPVIVETERGIHLVVMTGRLEGLNLPFEKVRERLEVRAAAESLENRLDRLADSLTGSSTEDKP
jgi:peptidyl-prolyl cis-trans isomerase C